MRGFVLGTGKGGGLSPPPLPPDDVLLDFSSPAAVSPALHSPTQRPEGRHHIGRQLSPGRSFQPNHAAFTTTSPMAGCGRGRTKIDTLGVAQSFPSRPTDPRLPSREPDFTKVSLKQTTARHQRAYELLRDFTPPRSPQNGLDHALAGKSDHRPELKKDLIS